jgi:lipopolysaccharide heptosyltransferase II
VNIRLVKSIDRIFGALLVWVMPTPKSIPFSVAQSFLIIRPGGIGDAVLLIPTIGIIKKKFPEATITVLAERRNFGIFSLSPDVDHILLYDRPADLWEAIRCNHDIVVDTEQWHRLSAIVTRISGAPVSIGFSTNERKRLFTHPVHYSHDEYETDSFLHLLEPLGIFNTEPVKFPFISIPHSVKDKALTLLGETKDKKFITVFPGASIPERRWGADNFKAVARHIGRKGFKVVVVGGKDDKSEGAKIVDGVDGINLSGKCSLAETAAVIDKSELLVTGDSGILHIGVGLGKPTVSLFGPGIARKWAPRGDKHIVINKNLSCSPCTKFGYTPKCPIGAQCLAEITVDEVFAAVERLLAME